MTLDQEAIDNGKVDPWNPPRDYMRQLRTARTEQTSTDLISRVRRAMARGKTVQAVPFPDAIGSADAADGSWDHTRDTVISANCGCSCGCHNTDHYKGCQRTGLWMAQFGVYACDECLSICDG